MRRFQILSTLALTLCAGVVACDGGDDGGNDGVAEADTSSTDPTGSEAEAETTANTDNTDGGCFEQPAECAQLIECFGKILPNQDMSQFEAGGTCWCGTEQEALDCYNICVSQLEVAVEQNQTVGECHGRDCPLEELDAAQPYGPPPCSGDAMELQGLPVDGSYCAPPCGGFAKDCPEHSQTIAEGTCYWNGGDNGFCALWCYVDPYIYASGTQCQCGATCQPYGGADGSGNQRGICTFE
jgi:hypothetical protein